MTLQVSAHYFLGRSFRNYRGGEGSEIQRNSSSNNRIVFLYLSLRSQKYSSRDYFDVSFEWKITYRNIFYNLYSISFENFLTRATSMKRNFLNFKNSLSSFVCIRAIFNFSSDHFYDRILQIRYYISEYNEIYNYEMIRSFYPTFQLKYCSKATFRFTTFTYVNIELEAVYLRDITDGIIPDSPLNSAFNQMSLRIHLLIQLPPDKQSWNSSARNNIWTKVNHDRADTRFKRYDLKSSNWNSDSISLNSSRFYNRFLEWIKKKTNKNTAIENKN